eukprot:CAMPEP_0172177776 /NCGR_PEP_ID=MMETSP1050-20130122/15648_1 /TAXON_ID=233186 /ORGANISM="Cryptomonas curvata, Strain CCAP979/52" /LENGTH=204 /DNA_ID=CAMNT_0012850381 /DNA_START=40 /DNA_END=652 /DNA_ORIENTATION=+
MKEFTAVLKDLQVVPGRLSRAQSEEIFKHANRASAVADANTAALDLDEFRYALRKVSERTGLTTDELVQRWRQPDAFAAERSIRSPRTPDPPLHKRASTIHLAHLSPGIDVGVRCGGSCVAASAADPARRGAGGAVSAVLGVGDRAKPSEAQTMDAKEFVGALTHLGLLPVRTTKTYAMDTFQRAKRHAVVGDQTELDWTAFAW